MTTDIKILPYTSDTTIFGQSAEILGSAFVTASNNGTPEEMQERVMVPLSKQAIEKGGNVLLCVRESTLAGGQSLFMASIGRRLEC